MKELNFTDVMGYTVEQMGRKGGVFLTVPGETPNTMTIGWAWIGWCWSRPVFIVAVRPQRHTYGLIEQADCFTVSVPTSDMSEALRMAGTLSGRDINKFEGHGITAAPAQKVAAPIVKECGLHFECKILLAEDMKENTMDAEVLRRCYPEKDFHRLYFGEIVTCYGTDEDAQ